MNDNSAVSILAGGDVQFDLIPKPERKVFRITEKTDWNKFFINRLKSAYFRLGNSYPNLFERLIDSFGHGFEKIHHNLMDAGFSYRNNFIMQHPLITHNDYELWNRHYRNNEVLAAKVYNYDFKNEEEKQLYPFRGLAELLARSDINFCNLECPLSDMGYIRGMFRGDPIYAEGLKRAGFDVVSIANNHAFDASEDGFVATMNNLEKAQILYVGGGRNFKDARLPRIMRVKGLKVAFLAYTALSDNGFYDDVAGEDKPGILPFSPPLILEDIRNIRYQCDILILSIHWGAEENLYIHNKAIEFAHQFINEGVDVILGHHPHVIKGIEIYKGKPIFYSFGNFIFGCYYDSWYDNFLAKIYIKEKMIDKIDIYPISGKGYQLFQPVLLKGLEAQSLITQLTKISSRFGTKIDIVDNYGVIKSRNN